MVKLSSFPIWHIISSAQRIWLCMRLNFGPLSGTAIDLQKMSILAKKIIFSDEAHVNLDEYVNKQNCRNWGHRKPARIHWKADTPKTSHCLVRILDQRHNWAIFLRKWGRRGRYSQWRSFSGHVERICVHKNWRGGYWQHLVSTGRLYVPHSRCYTQCFALCFWRSHYQSQSWCRLAISAAIWHRWTIIYGVASKINVTPTSQRQLTL